MDMPISSKYITHALERERDVVCWDMWISLYPDMMKEYLKFISFDDFKKSIFSKEHKYTSISTEDIEKEFNGIIKR